MRQGQQWTVWCVGFLMGLGVLGVGVGYADDAVQPTIFQAAGPSVEAIKGTVDAFRAELGEPDNGNNGSQASGRREINWDGGGNNDTTTPPVTGSNSPGSRSGSPGNG